MFIIVKTGTHNAIGSDGKMVKQLAVTGPQAESEAFTFLITEILLYLHSSAI